MILGHWRYVENDGDRISRDTLYLPRVTEEDEITVNSSFPHPPFIYHSRDYQLVGYEGSLNYSSSAGQRLGCLPAVIHESHSLLSLKCPRGPWSVYLSSFKTNLHPRCLWTTARCSRMCT